MQKVTTRKGMARCGKWKTTLIYYLEHQKKLLKSALIPSKWFIYNIWVNEVIWRKLLLFRECNLTYIAQVLQYTPALIAFSWQQLSLSLYLYLPATSQKNIEAQMIHIGIGMEKLVELNITYNQLILGIFLNFWKSYSLWIRVKVSSICKWSWPEAQNL